VLLAASLALASVGCGGPRTYPVGGVVVFEDGTSAGELAGGMVQFESVEGGVSAQGVIGEGGVFQLTTSKDGDGAVAGEHRVAVLPPMPADIDRKRKPILDPRFHDFSTSLLVQTVAPRANQLTIQVARPRP
jgi:hypothetical protein